MSKIEPNAKLEKAARQALVAMESFQNGTNKLFDGEFEEEITALREALEQLKEKTELNNG